MGINRYLAGLTFHQPDENGVCRGWKLVAHDGSSRNGQFHWPLVSAKAGQPAVEVRASNPDPTNTGPCPEREGDGLCLAKTVVGAQSGGLVLSRSTILLVTYAAADVLGEDTDKIRVGACRVVDVVDPLHLIQAGLAVDLSGADLSGADLTGANLSGADLRWATLYRANLSGATLREANLSGADLSGANLRWATLYRANLSGATLREANLTGTNLSEANLSEANLSGADLRWAIFNTSGG